MCDGFLQRGQDSHLLAAFEPDSPRPIFITVGNQSDLVVAGGQPERPRRDAGKLSIDINSRGSVTVNHQVADLTITFHFDLFDSQFDALSDGAR